jgi:hypothetical protein
MNEGRRMRRPDAPNLEAPQVRSTADVVKLVDTLS